MHMPRPKLRDPHAGPQNARAYILHWGDALYRQHCHDHQIVPVSYPEFVARTLQLGKDWWCRHE